MRPIVQAIALTVSFMTLAWGAPTGLLNDTGQTHCYDSGNVAVACDFSGVGSDSGVNPRQDARFGRDAKAATGTLTKVGGGAAGFDFTKVCANGDLAGQGSCAADPQTTDANPWACTKDNTTNLIWSLQTFAGVDWWTASWNYPGSPADLHNSAVRCGIATTWRLPSRRELLSIVHRGTGSPVVDASYFPATAANSYWSNDPFAPWNTDPFPTTYYAWAVYFNDGSTGGDNADLLKSVRLVSDGS